MEGKSMIFWKSQVLTFEKEKKVKKGHPDKVNYYLKEC